MIWPSITVVTPSLNQGRFLEDTLRSVLEQNYPHLEYIVIDGGSTDGSVNIMRRYTDRLAHWTSEPDNGQTDALIKGFAKSSSEIMAWLNSDDMYEPRTLWEVGRFFSENPAAEAVYGDATWIDVFGNRIRAKKEHPFSRFVWLHDHNYIPQPSTFWRRSLYDRVGGLNPAFDLAMDADLWIRFADVTQFHHVRRCWSRMRYYPEQKNRRLRRVSDDEDLQIRRRYLGAEPEWSRVVKRVLAKGMRVAWKLATGCYW